MSSLSKKTSECVSTKDSVSQCEIREAKIRILLSVTCFHYDHLVEERSNKYHVFITHKDNVILQNACDISENSKSVLHGHMEIDYYNIDEMSDLVDNPLLVLVQETVTSLKKGSVKAMSGNSSLSPLGYCNFDLSPLLTVCHEENNFIEETMYIQPLRPSSSIETTTWPNLPTIALRAEIEKDDTCELQFFNSLNILTLTMEMLCDVPSCITSEYDCSIFTFIPKQDEILQEVSFYKGLERSNANVETAKKWGALCEIEGRGNVSIYPISTKNPMNPQKIRLDVFTDAEVHLIEWNSFHRNLLDYTNTAVLMKFIKNNRCWPVEIYIVPKVQSGKSMTSKKGAEDKSPLHLMAFPDVSPLLYPGESSVRVVTAVYLYNEEYMISRGGRKSFVLDFPTAANAPSVLAPAPLNVSSTTLCELQCEEAYNEAGCPLYFIMQLELSHPLVEKKTLENIYDDIHKLLPIRNIDVVIEKAQSAKKKYHQCIKDFINTLNLEYAAFLKNSKVLSSKVAGDDEMSAFIRYLHTSGVHSNLVGTLTDCVIQLVNDNFKLGESIESEDDYECFISRVFIELVNEMHKTLMIPKSKVFKPSVNSKDLLYYAREEEALSHYREAETLHLQRISLNEKNAQIWFDYAIFCLGLDNYEKAYTAICEVVQLDFHHRLGLLMGAVLLMYREQYKEAENFLLAMMKLYPKFFQGYIASYIFYKKIGRYEAADITFNIAKNMVSEGILCCCSNINCMCDKDEFMVREEFFWYDSNIPKMKIFLRTSALFIRLRLLEFAEIILADELEEEGTSLFHDYLLATTHFFQGKYEAALKHLQQEVYETQATYLISSLEGHCLHSLNSMNLAAEAFEYTNLCFDRPNDIHLVYMRLGQHYLNTGMFTLAKKMFITSCNYSPTSNTWLGVGIAFLKMEMYIDCEKCLIEANFLNQCSPLVWAYLAILNASLHMETEFKKCYVMAFKNGLSDERLILEIEELIAKIFPEEECLGLKFNSIVF